MSATLYVPALLILGVLALLIHTLRRLEKMGKSDHGKVAQNHHGYIGAGLAFVVLVIIHATDIHHDGLIVALILCHVLGMWWLCDDTYQHLRQLTEPFYRSSWHRFAHKVGLI